jgi:hypothetical protein
MTVIQFPMPLCVVCGARRRKSDSTLVAARISPHRRLYTVSLTVLLALFCFRVLAQLTLWFVEIPFLPPFEAWQSGAVPYGALLVAQIVIIAFYGWILQRVMTNRIRPSRRAGRVFLVVGSIYFLAMVLRLVAGVTGIAEGHWFRSYLPTLFHFVLSGYLIVVGLFHLQAASQRP